MKQKKAAAPPIEKPPQPGRVRAVFLAVVVHAAFFALIVFGVAWQSRPDVPVIAEMDRTLMQRAVGNLVS